MKFCTKCGTQLLDEAMICTKCGCMVEDAHRARKQPRVSYQLPSGVVEGKPSTSLAVFGFLFHIFTIISLLFIVLSIKKARMFSLANYAYLRLSEYELTAGLVFSLIAFVFALVSFILTLTEQQRGERLFSGILKLVAGVVLVFAFIGLIF